MNPLILIGFLAFFFASLAVGVRLVALYFRTRELPELLIGIGVLGIGPVGFGMMMAGTLFGRDDPGLQTLLFCLGSVASLTGILAKCLFNWRVYHSTSRAMRAFAMALGALLVGLFLQQAFVSGFVPDKGAPSASSLSRSALQVGCLLWGSLEAFRYWLLMRRRQRLGLAEPVVTNRFLLWSIGAGAAGLGSAVGTITGMIVDKPSLEIPWVVASSSAHGFVAAVAMSLAFLPPAAYLRYIRGHAEKAQDAA